MRTVVTPLAMRRSARFLAASCRKAPVIGTSRPRRCWISVSSTQSDPPCCQSTLRVPLLPPCREISGRNHFALLREEKRFRVRGFVSPEEAGIATPTTLLIGSYKVSLSFASSC